MQAVIAAQSFHWFANDKSISEIHRVLVPGGKLGLVWILRDHSTPWVKELDDEVLLPLYKQSNTPNVKFGDWEEALSTSEKFGLMNSDGSFRVDQTVHGFDEFINKIKSISVIAAQNKEEMQRTIDRVKLILSKHKQEKETFTFPYSVMIYWCQKT